VKNPPPKRQPSNVTQLPFPRYVELVPRGGDTFRIRPLVERGDDIWLTALECVHAAREAGARISAPSIYRWADEGFINDFYSAPRKRLFSLKSLNNHIATLKGDREFWSVRESRSKSTASRKSGAR
jgi:hypothetical protein